MRQSPQAKAKPTYWELLKHPNWQRKRLEVLESNGFACEDCGSTENTLNVHHTYYEKGLKPWEYPSESLRALCEDCHKKAQDIMTSLHRQIGKLELSDITRLFGCALGLEAWTFPHTPIEVSSYDVAVGISDVWGVSEVQVMDALRDGVIDGYKLLELRTGKKVDE